MIERIFFAGAGLCWSISVISFVVGLSWQVAYHNAPSWLAVPAVGGLVASVICMAVVTAVDAVNDFRHP